MIKPTKMFIVIYNFKHDLFLEVALPTGSKTLLRKLLRARNDSVIVHLTDNGNRGEFQCVKYIFIFFAVKYNHPTRAIIVDKYQTFLKNQSIDIRRECLNAIESPVKEIIQNLDTLAWRLRKQIGADEFFDYANS